MRLAIFAGPTGGHFYPALAFAEAYKKLHVETQILIVTGERGRSLVEKARARIEADFEFLPDFPFPSPRQTDFLIRTPAFLIQLAQAFSKTEKILDAFKPDLSVGFGSYISFPAILASRRRRIPTLIHEQNRKMGRANAWLTRYADRIALSFIEDGGQDRRKIVTGLPLRSALLESTDRKNKAGQPISPSRRIKILIIGGSQGAHGLNLLWMGTTEQFSDEEKNRIAVIHITGEKDYEWVKAMYLEEGIEASVFMFYEQMEELYSQADLAITRAGAGTLFELALFGLPAIVIPYPYAEGHQEWNARYFEKEEAMGVVPEIGTIPGRLKEEIMRLVNSEPLRKNMSENLRRLSTPDASKRLVELAEALVTKNKVEAIL